MSHVLCREAKVYVIPVMTGGGTAEGESKQKAVQTSAALPPRAKHNDLLTFSLC